MRVIHNQHDSEVNRLLDEVQAGGDWINLVSQTDAGLLWPQFQLPNGGGINEERLIGHIQSIFETLPQAAEEVPNVYNNLAVVAVLLETVGPNVSARALQSVASIRDASVHTRFLAFQSARQRLKEAPPK